MRQSLAWLIARTYKFYTDYVLPYLRLGNARLAVVG